MPETIVSIHQPQYLAWVPYFDKILRADRFVLLDNVPFQKNGLQNRNQIKTPHGISWLTVPVKQHLGQLICATEIADPMSLDKHLKTLEFAYKKSRFYDEIVILIDTVLQKHRSLLADLNHALILNFLVYLGFTGELIKASELGVSGAGSDLILDICRKLGATEYLSGPGGRNYMKLEDFKRAGIRVVFQEYKNVPYPQLFTEQGFVPNLSVIDLLFNLGKDSRPIIEKGRLH